MGFSLGSFPISQCEGNTGTFIDRSKTDMLRAFKKCLFSTENERRNQERLPAKPQPLGTMTFPTVKLDRANQIASEPQDSEPDSWELNALAAGLSQTKFSRPGTSKMRLPHILGDGQDDQLELDKKTSEFLLHSYSYTCIKMNTELNFI